jgi:hypothetical protein
VSQLITIRMDSMHICLGYKTALVESFIVTCRTGIFFKLLNDSHVETESIWLTEIDLNSFLSTENAKQWLVAGIRTGIIIAFLEFYGRLWGKCASSVLSMVCRTHLSHFQFVANMNVYEHIGNTLCSERNVLLQTLLFVTDKYSLQLSKHVNNIYIHT